MKITRTLPSTVKTIHFIGIGGIGMSGIAEILHGLGYRVQGSDASENANVKRLKNLGIHVYVGHKPEHVQGVDVVVISTAIKQDNPEFVAARMADIPWVHRAEMLGEIMRLHQSVAVGGTHGKTTTTSLVYSLLLAGGIGPTVINGGILNAFGSNARIGDGEWLVVEADESDGSFKKYRPTISVVTNIEPEHMEYYGTEARLVQAFTDFVESIPFYGLSVLCLDDPRVAALARNVRDRRIRTYGFNPEADLRAENLRPDGMGTVFDLVTGHQVGAPRERDLRLNVPGRHNVQNALAAVAVADELGVSRAVVREALAAFGGVKRRFTIVAKAGGITVVDDYGHHPTEIAAVLDTARQAFAGGRVIAIVQPHRYTRLRDHFDGFARVAAKADQVYFTPVYAAGEDEIEGMNSQALAQRATQMGHGSAQAVAGYDDLAARLDQDLKPGDGIIFLGAGSITAWAADYGARLARRFGQ